MLTEICQELRNWFDTYQDKWLGDFVIEDGVLSGEGVELQDGQYYRIISSVFNDGVHQVGVSSLFPERFRGAVWAMAVPPQIIALSEKIQAWLDKYGGIDSVAMSPYNSESFGGYSYSKSGGASGSGAGSGADWRSAFAADLNRWRKI